MVFKWRSLLRCRLRA
ncbi:hypothetical protein MTR67_044543 [Solanum verrucosum]|uniref:Uncharacterized protein n=1 Tax=Solanum verrucosum TaxID=315347 RepID=A0AAF0UQQ8_SOLVR|nr:hypothetical protein MTR67_044543 [Solanum verrucosum]